MLDAMVGFLGKNAMTAYLCMMGVRLTELHRVLKPTGSLYLHCDPTASHYLKVLLDAVFGARNFQAELIWQRTNARGTKGRWPWIHDVILHTAKSDAYAHHSIDKPADKAKMPHTLITGPDGLKYQTYELTGAGTPKGETGKAWRGFDPNELGRHWGSLHSVMDEWAEEGLIHWPSKNGFPRRRSSEPFDPASRRVVVGDVWTDIQRLNQTAQERLGYPTQKPVALLERIVSASSGEGDTVLDPFCGCGTTVHAAQKLGRRWIGIDVTHLAISLIETRLKDAFGPKAQFEVHGTPKDVAAARDFFDRDDRTKKEFEKWACGLIAAYPQSGGKKGADGGIDGTFWFGKDKKQKAIVSVKGGRNVGVAMIRELDAVVTREKADLGVFLTLEEPTRNMVAEAKGMGTLKVEGFDPRPRIQIVTVEDALDRGPAAVDAPLRHGDTYKAAPKEKDEGAQGSLAL
ncbi:MAG: DNA methyltransferase [Hasllibacter sp.]